MNHAYTLALVVISSSLLRPACAGDLAEVLCVQVERVVGNDNCVRYQGRCLQIPPQRHRHHFVKVKVRVHAYEDGRLAVFHGPRCLARYQPNGHRADVEATIKPAA